MDVVLDRETLRTVEVDTPNRLTKQFVALTPTELVQEILKISQAAVVRSVSTEVAVRFHRYRKGPFSAMTSPTDDCFLQLFPDTRND